MRSTGLLSKAPPMHSFLFSLLLLIISYSYTPKVSAQPTSSYSASNSAKLEFRSMHQCEKNFSYEIFLAGTKIGSQQRRVKWSNQQGNTEATVESSGEVKIFGIGSQYQQTASLVFSKKHQQFLSRSFHQISTGINARNFKVTLSDDGKQADIVLNGKPRTEKISRFPLYDIDTMGAQIRLHLLNKKTTFELYRLSSKKIKKYSFKVIGEEKIKTKTWGDIDAIRINEIGDFSKMVLWFSPKHDLQMVKANIDAIISPTVFLTQFNIQCM